MNANSTVRIPFGASFLSTPTRTNRRLLAGFFIGLLLAASLVAVIVNHDGFAFASNPSTPNNPASPTVGARDPLTWPFSRDSIWNLPIGSNANYVGANIAHATAMANFVDTDVIVMKPNAPLTNVYANYDDWGAGARCAAQGPVVFSAPIPSDFVYAGNHQGNPDGDTPNAAAAILAADGHTIIQTQPFARCAGLPPVSNYMYPNEDIYGTGVTGAHGGAGLSSVGGTVRLGELVPAGMIRHTLKLNIDSINFYASAPSGPSYRWPATKSDGGVFTSWYGGSVPQVKMGSLLALHPNFNVANLETEPGRIVAEAMKDYGAYIVDTAGWSVYGFIVERSPDGGVRDEFQARWGYSLNAAIGANGWARDLEKIFTNLNAVDNWDRATWQTVSASNGALGAGLGAPRVAWAPDFGQVPPPPPPPPPPPSTVGTTLTLTTSKNPSTVNETISVRGRLVDATGAPVAGRAVTLEWSVDQTAWEREAQIGQFAPTDANGAFSGMMAFRGITAHTEYIRARFGGDSTYTASSSPVVAQGVVVPPPGPLTVSATVSGTSGANGWYVSAVTVGLSTSGSAGATTIMYSIDNGPSTIYRSPLAFQEGRHALLFQASNASGYFGPAQYGTFVVDWTAPTVAPTYDHVVLRPDAPLSWIGSDGLSGVARYEVSVDGGSFQSVGSESRLAGPWTTGSHTAVVRAYDGAGNTARTSFSFQVDANAAPVPTTQPGQAPTVPSIALPIVAVLGLTSIVLAAAAALIYRRVRRSSIIVKKIVTRARTNPKLTGASAVPGNRARSSASPRAKSRRASGRSPRQKKSFENSDDYLDCPV